MALFQNDTLNPTPITAQRIILHYALRSPNLSLHIKSKYYNSIKNEKYIIFHIHHTCTTQNKNMSNGNKKRFRSNHLKRWYSLVDRIGIEPITP